MFKVKKIFVILAFALLSTSISNACETLTINDIIKEIKASEGSSKIKEVGGRFYVDSNLLSLQKDGIHLVYDSRDFMVPYIYNDTTGYLLNHDLCVSLGIVWGCCNCGGSNPYWQDVCGRCNNRRCGK